MFYVGVAINAVVSYAVNMSDDIAGHRAGILRRLVVYLRERADEIERDIK